VRSELTNIDFAGFRVRSHVTNKRGPNSQAKSLVASSPRGVTRRQRSRNRQEVIPCWRERVVPARETVLSWADNPQQSDGIPRVRRSFPVMYMEFASCARGVSVDRDRPHCSACLAPGKGDVYAVCQDQPAGGEAGAAGEDAFPGTCAGGPGLAEPGPWSGARQPFWLRAGQLSRAAQGQPGLVPVAYRGRQEPDPGGSPVEREVLMTAHESSEHAEQAERRDIGEATLDRRRDRLPPVPARGALPGLPARSPVRRSCLRRATAACLPPDGPRRGRRDPGCGTVSLRPVVE
jgi:hypothetical protein